MAASFELKPEVIEFDPAAVDRMDLNCGILARWARRSWPTSQTAFADNAHKMDPAHQTRVRKVHPCYVRDKRISDAVAKRNAKELAEQCAHYVHFRWPRVGKTVFTPVPHHLREKTLLHIEADGLTIGLSPLGRHVLLPADESRTEA